MQKILYRTIATNKDGVNGFVSLDDGKSFAVSSPLKNLDGTNPEQLLGASFATCLSETLRVILLTNRKKNAFKVEVIVDLVADEVNLGYQFLVHAKIAIDQVSMEDAVLLVEQTKKKCPVSRLFMNHKNVSYEAVSY